MTTKLQRVVGLPGAVFLGLGSIVGTGAFVALGLAAEPSGGWLPVAVLVAGALATCNGLSSAQLASAFPTSGGTYEYAYRVLSPFWGRAAGAAFLVGKVASAATAALGLSAYLGWGKEEAVLVVVGVAVAIALGMRRTQWINGLLVGVSLFALVVFVVFGFFETAPPLPSSPGLGGILEGAALVFVAFTGYGRVATLGEEIANPARNIPRAVVLTLAVSIVLYLAVSWVALGLGGVAGFYQGAVQGAPLQALARYRLPDWTVGVLNVGAFTAMVSVLLNLLLGLSRVVLAMGRRGDLPGFLATVTKGGNPLPALVLVTVLVAVGAGWGSIAGNWSLSAVTVLGYYAITNAAALTQEAPRLPRFVPQIGLAGCVILPLAIRSGTFVLALGLWAGAIVLLWLLSKLS